jgi:transposase-like protein
MDLKEQIILEYLEQGCGYRKLQEQYGISRTTICKWVQIYQGVHNLERTENSKTITLEIWMIHTRNGNQKSPLWRRYAAPQSSVGVSVRE